MKSSTLNFALIGCGRIGERHAELINRFGRLAAVCDIVPAKAQQLADKYNAPVYTDFTTLLQAEKQLDVCVVCSPNGLHAQQSIAILDAGIHVLCEKPMAITVSDCEKMIDAAQRSGKSLFVVKQNRFNPPMQALKKILDEARLGRIYTVQVNCFWNRDASYYKDSWRGTRDLDGGTLFTQFSHFIDLLYWLIGDMNDVVASTANFNHVGIIDFEDSGSAIMHFENDVMVMLNYTVNSYARNMEGSFTVFGEKGTIKIGGEYLNKIEYDRIEDYTIPPMPQGSKPNDYGSYQGSMSNHDKVYENFLAFLGKKEEAYISTVESMKTVEIISRIYAAAKMAGH